MKCAINIGGARRTARAPLTLQRLTTEQQRWQAYEAAKHLWEQQHPSASTQEHEDAMRELAQRVGV